MTEKQPHISADHKSFETKLHIGVAAAVIAMVIGVSGSGTADKAAGDISEESIISHKALYKMQLKSVSSGVPLTDVKGELFFKWQEHCDNWQTDHKFSVDYYYADRPNAKVRSSYQAVEMKDKSAMFFDSESKRDGMVEEAFKGQATRNLDDQTGLAVYKQPSELSFDLPAKFVFPTEHSRIFVEKALAGERFYHAVLFDGTDADGPVVVNAFIGEGLTGEQAVNASYDTEKVDLKLIEQKSWPVRLAFFAEDDLQETPLYEMQMTLHDNGIVSDITMEYKQFSIHQELVALEKIPAMTCDRKNQ